jgi:hypothetical protein
MNALGVRLAIKNLLFMIVLLPAVVGASSVSKPYASA